MRPFRHSLPQKREVACTTCQTRIDASASRVASLVPSFDSATLRDLEQRSESRDWNLDGDTNVPCCDCDDVCQPYLLHLESSRAGFSSHAAYLAYQRLIADKPPQVVLDNDDDDPPGNSPTESPIGEHPTQGLATAEIPNSDLIAHHKKIIALQAARGRLVINKFLQEDAAAATRFQGVEAVLEAMKRSAKAKRDQQKERLTELTKALQRDREEVAQLETALEAIEAERPRRHTGADPTSGSFLQPPSLSLTPCLTTHPLLLYAGCPISGDSLPITRQSLCDLSVLTAAELTTLRLALKQMKAPPYDVPPDFFARWLQVQQNTRIKGVPVCGPEWIVDLRDVRGRNTVMSRVPPVTTNKRGRDQHKLCLFAVLRVLAIPGAYRAKLLQLRAPVAGDPILRSVFHQERTTVPEEDEVVHLLANHGLTVEAADDSFQFCTKLLQAHHNENPNVFGPNASGDLLQRVQNELEISGPPPGLSSRGQDLLPRFNGLG
ncbi:hypothetical protein B0H12DRAFT_1242613 [Mycena haematopus]|nr:hypothetical protein B0H12DRAFT_1242613 [Mycena haematopus]